MAETRKIELKINSSAVADFLVQFIRRQAKGCGFSRMVVGLSGGLDSSVSCYLGVQALGSESVIAFIMPYRTSDPQGKADARQVAEWLGIQYQEIDITPQIDAYFAEFPEADRIRQGNKMARERMSILYDQAQASQALVLGTGNRTEALLGYTTLWGDMACSLNPLGGLYKTQVRQLAREVGVPRQIIEKAPSADLWVNQTDEGELGFTYEQVDCLLHAMIDLRWRKEELEQEFGPEFVSRVRQIIRRSAFKRRMPPAPKMPWDKLTQTR